jgi:hypothetical protein
MTMLLSLLVATLPSQPLFALEPTTSEPLSAFGARAEPSPFLAYSPIARAPEDFPEMEYTYIEANYLGTDSKIADDTIDGYELTGSFEFPLNIFVQGTVSQQSGDADLDRYRLGVGWHFGFTSRFDAYGILSWEELKLDGSGDDFTDDSAAAEIGLRVLLTRSIEVNGRSQWSDNGDGDPSVGVGARFYFSGNLSLGARYDTTGDEDTGSVGLRFEI